MNIRSNQTGAVEYESHIRTYDTPNRVRSRMWRGLCNLRFSSDGWRGEVRQYRVNPRGNGVKSDLQPLHYLVSEVEPPRGAYREL